MRADLLQGIGGEMDQDRGEGAVRGGTAAVEGKEKFRRPPPTVKAMAAKKRPAVPEKKPEETAAAGAAAMRKAGMQQTGLLVVGGLLMVLIGGFAPASFMQHFIVFALACFVGFQVIWGVSHSLHTPLMAITNAISGIIILGALLQLGDAGIIVKALAAVSVLVMPAYGFVVPFFGVVLSGASGAAVWFAILAGCVALAWGSARRAPWAWWGGVVAIVLATLSSVITAVRVDPAEFVLAMGLPEEQMVLLSGVAMPGLLLMVLVWVVVWGTFVGYLMTVRGCFLDGDSDG